MGSSINSPDIVRNVDARLHLENSITDDEEAKWLRWVGDHLVHMLAPNIYRTTSEALESFDCIANNGNFTTTQRFAVKYAGTAIMYVVSKKLRRNMALQMNVAHCLKLQKHGSHLLMAEIFSVNLAVFGVLRPIKHLKSGKDLLLEGQQREKFNVLIFRLVKCYVGEALGC